MPYKDKEQKKQQQQKYDEQRKDSRGRNWCLIFYPEDLPSDWLERLKTEWQAPMLVSPLHDQDYTAEGKPKKPHYHVIFFFPTLHSGGQLKRELGDMFGTAENGSVIGVANIVSSCLVRNRNLMVRYLAHLDDADKHRYDENDIQGFNGADVTKELVRSQEETQALIVEMEEFIEQEGITELAEFSSAIRYSHPEWHTILATRMTIYFSNFIRSRRHMAEKGVIKLPPKMVVDPETGEVLK